MPRPRPRIALTQALLKEILHYDPETGHFTWLVPRCNRATMIGKRAGYIHERGHMCIGIDNYDFRVHKLAYLFMEGCWPSHTVRHRDEDKTNNKWENIKYVIPEPVNKVPLTQDRLKEFLNYNPETGEFTHLPHKGVRKNLVGKIAGYPNRKGYLLIRVDKQEYLAHRLAHLFMEGYFPEYDVDHKDRIKSNNKWDNLRHVSHACNMQNVVVREDNKSGITGVRKWGKKWGADIRVNWILKWGGMYDTIEEAAIARWRLEVEYKRPNCDTTSSARCYLIEKGLLGENNERLK